MRYLCVLLIVLGLPLTAGAQHNRQSPPPPPPIGLGAIGLPLASMGLPPTINHRQWTVAVPAWERPQVPAWERQGPPPWERGHAAQPVQVVKPGKHDRNRRRQTNVVFVPYASYGYGYTSGLPYAMAPTTVATPAPAPEAPSDIGYLRLEVEPATLLQIYVDGVFVGTPADLRGELELRAGAHRIEIRAPGYEPLTFDVRVEAERGITYRADLRPAGAPPPPAAPVVVPSGSKTLYVIPGCYLGNVPPDVDRLPAGCDISRMKTHAP